ncbi:Na(+)/H(+) exchange regulatory cofactor NHE-RF2 [Chelonia mydas]|uniref:Na(+)/H(+) exchange regulatory cofactor NHE-RF2 n=1 Tax=Chelonia mydas TaxID=8469 RepID=M7BXY1_CHEMY|nr:Na(+)/H(+) exchange regulatory cofactor NHE-RF2 [Chelonia mydas]
MKKQQQPQGSEEGIRDLRAEAAVVKSTSKREPEPAQEDLAQGAHLWESKVVQRIKAVESETRLLVVDKETDEYLCSLRLTCTEEMVHAGIPTTAENVGTLDM